MSKIKYIVMDVDGTLTDGKIYMSAGGEIMKAFNIKDGYGIHDLLPKEGIIPLIITGRKSLIVEQRCKELGIGILFQNVSDKLAQLCDFLKNLNIKLSEVAYIGDDLNDYSCMSLIKEKGGVVCSPADACSKVKQIADYVASANGGDGAVREIIDWLINN